MRKILQKLNRASGFSLSEVLVAVLILVLITAGVIPAAMRAYRNAIDAANAQVILSTTVQALRNELSTAWDVQQEDDEKKSVTFMSAGTGSRSKLYIEDSTIMLQEYVDFPDDDPSWMGNDESLVKPTQTKRALVVIPETHLTVEYGEINPNVSGCVSISGLVVKRGAAVLAKMPDDAPLLIRPLGG